ncbi:MAG: glycosyltransferase [Candidatus Dadabacteria bacterium]|nr:glycosyltransferase [Candidatus Dadabacteria bacterium]
MKRILFATNNMTLGGTEKRMVELANGLCEKGFKIAFFIFNTRERMGWRMKDLRPEIEVILPCRDYVKPSILAGSWEIIKTIWKWKPDVIYSALWNTKAMATIAGRILGIRVVLGISNSPVCEISRKKHKFLNVLYRKIVYKLAHVVIAVSEGLAEESKKFYRLSNVRAIHSGVDIEDIKRRSRSDGKSVPHEYFRGSSPVLVATGSLHPQKGHKYMLEALSIVNASADARLIIVGGGLLEDELRRKAKLLKIDDKVSMVGQREPYAYMACCDIFVHSSIYEGLPMALIEAMSLGLPIVSTRCNHGPAELITDGESGLLVPVADPEKLASGILRLISDKKLRSDLGDGAEKRSRLFTRDRMVSDYERVFMDV